MGTAKVADDAMCARRLVLRGQVQGLGVRPAVARAARQADLAGGVRNIRAGLEIEVEGNASSVESFIQQLASILPRGVTFVLENATAIAPQHRESFDIEPSTSTGTSIGTAPVDRAICAECLAELRDPRNRRFGYVFTHCAACGPRYSILERMPYDRDTTSMRDFPRCAECEREYRDPFDRRFHAETICCARCGPQLWASDGESRHVIAGALDCVAEVVRRGGIAAIKGIGGYQLLADALDPAAVRRLREKKRRPAKPLAVMVRTMDEAERMARLSRLELDWLASAENPIVIVRRGAVCPLADEVALNCGTIGLFLPSSALHALLLQRIGRPVVCTSGNLEGDPLAYCEQDAEQRLREVADIWLHHDRRIVRPIDDSVVRVIAGELCVLRAGRGFAPCSLTGPAATAGVSLFALGGELKSAVALWTGRDAVLGPHVGDLTEVGACQRWAQVSDSLRELYDVPVGVVACDLHPDYFTTRVAEERFCDRVAVQHHHAHAAAVLWEHERFDATAVALTWDGAGYGDDGVSWGGECLLASLKDYRRVAHLRPFALPGGDLAVREPWRVAVSLATQCGLHPALLRMLWPDVSETRFTQVWDLAARPGLSPRSTSVGRLFDAVAAIAFNEAKAEYEGQLAMRLEAAYDPRAQGAYTIAWNQGEAHFDWLTMLPKLLDDKRRNAAPGAISARFHRALANLARQVADRFPELPLVTCGGVFQNAVLGELIAEEIGNRPAGWLRPRRAPPGDGGLALGQLAVAWAGLRESRQPSQRASSCA